jgi:hypothetical protein
MAYLYGTIQRPYSLYQKCTEAWPTAQHCGVVWGSPLMLWVTAIDCGLCWLFVGKPGFADAVAESIFPGQGYSNLSDAEENDIWVSQQLLFLWQNEDNLGRVYSTSCDKEFHLHTHNPLSPYPNCVSLLISKNFW